MNSLLKDKYNLFIKNLHTLDKQYEKLSLDIIMLCGMMYVVNDESVNIEKIKICEELLKEREVFMSEFKGKMYLPIVCKMAMSKDPKKYYNKLRMTYDLLNKSNWIGTVHRVIAAITICDRAKASEISDCVARTEEIFKKMKKEHPYITSEEDVCMAAVLAMSNIDVDTLIFDIEKCYTNLKPKFSSCNALQALTHILALNDEMLDTKCERVINLHDSLKSSQLRFDTYYEIALLGILAFIDINTSDIVSSVCEVEDLLKQQAGFDSFIKGNIHRKLYASLLVAETFMPEEEREDEHVLSSLALVIAEEIMVMSLMVALNNR